MTLKAEADGTSDAIGIVVVYDQVGASEFEIPLENSIDEN